MNSDAYELGKESGALFAAILVILGMAKCAALAKKPECNSRAFYALAFALLLLVLGQIANILKAKFVSSPLLAFAFSFGVVAVAIVSMTLAAIALSEISRDPEPRRGKGQAIASVLISIFFLGAVTWGFTQGIQKRKEAAPEEWKTEQPATKELVFEKLNFKFKTPPGPWVMIDVKKLNKDATLGFIKKNPDVMFFVIAEDLGENRGIQTDALVEIMKSNLKAATKTVDFKETTPVKVGTLAGVQVVSEGELASGLPLRNVQWAYTDGRYLYQLITGSTSPETTTAQVREAAKEIRENFRLIRTFVASAPGAPAQNVTYLSGFYPFSIMGKLVLWKRDLQYDIPEADPLSLKVGDRAQFLVFPLRLHDADVDEDELIAAIQESIKLVPPADARSKTDRDCRMQTWSDGAWNHTVRFCRSDRLFYTFHEKTAANDPDMKNLQDPFDLINFNSFRNREVTAPGQPPPGARFATEVYTILAHRALQRNETDRGLHLLTTAFETDSSDANILLEIVDLLLKNNRKDDAKAYLSAHIEKVASNDRVRAYYVQLNRP